MNKTTILKTDGTRVVREYPEGRPTLKEEQAAVGDGLIETVPHLELFEGEQCVAFCNEEGRIDGLPFNADATKLWLANLGKGPFRYEPLLYGDVIILTGDEEFMNGE